MSIQYIIATEPFQIYGESGSENVNPDQVIWFVTLIDLINYRKENNLPLNNLISLQTPGKGNQTFPGYRGK